MKCSELVTELLEVLSRFRDFEVKVGLYSNNDAIKFDNDISLIKREDREKGVVELLIRTDIGDCVKFKEDIKVLY